jgi:PAS domain S-box-containing protein
MPVSGVFLADGLSEAALAAGAAGRWNWDIAGRVLRMDARLAKLHGLDPETAAEGLPTGAFFTAIHPDDVRRVRIAVAGVLHGVELFTRSFRLVAPDGAIRWVEAHGRTELDEEGQPERFSGFIVDVTGRREVEERLRIAQSAGQVGTFEHVPGFATASISEQFCALLGLQPADVLPLRTINGLVAPGHPPLFGSEALREGETSYREVRVLRADTGESRWIARRGETLRSSEGGLRHAGVIYDITKTRDVQEKLEQLNGTLELRVQQEVASRMEAEEALRQSQKMEAVGQLTGGIAHDFNNLLTVIIGNLEMAVRRLGASGDERVGRSLANAVKGAERASVLTQRLLAFSRRQPLDPKQIDVSRLLRGMADLLARTIGETIHLETGFEPSLWPIEVDPNQLENAIVNLAVNARDAMNGEGSLTIRAENVTVGANRGAADPEPGDYVVLSVTDTGSGMSAETIARACDPFFTTKEVGKGTGLGLSMVYGFVTQSGGHIDIRSELGAGTTIRIFLPRHHGLASFQEDGAARQADEGETGETVLVVEDDDDVRAYAVEGLTELGYRVLQAKDGATALVELARHGSGIRLLFTDVIMPAMSGRELAEAARRMRPDLRVLYTSGYPREVIVRDGRLEPGVELLPKPFTFVGLAAKVREALDA